MKNPFKKTKYVCTERVRYYFLKQQALLRLVDMYVKENNDIRAREAIIDAEKAGAKAWEYIYFLYPFTAEGNWQWNSLTNTIKEQYS